MSSKPKIETPLPVDNYIIVLLGAGCVIVKNRRRLCGTGAALANAPIVQDKSYFEVMIQTGGTVLHY